ncbi:MAG: inositol oxygenase family protein [Cyclobacteriaceae bacterium]
MKENQNNELNPMGNIDDWEDNLLERYPNPEENTNENKKTKEEFRVYDGDHNRLDTVREFYRLNHLYQSYDFVSEKEKEFLKFDRRQMSLWEAVDFLNTLVDDSDPDIELDQLQHLLQTSEAIRADGHPDWFVLTGFLHDMGKVLCLFGEPQWAVVGDTFPVGCAFSEKIVYSEFFKDNPDYKDERYNTRYGVYKDRCGLDNVKMSWGHDEYLYHIMKDHLPEPALYMIRYHSFYGQHREEAYDHLMNDNDLKMFDWVRKFNQYDLYSKAPVPPDAKALRPYYEDLVSKYLPETLSF